MRKKNLHKEMDHWSGGVQFLYRFPNNYGASVIPELRTAVPQPEIVPGLYELAVIRYGGRELDGILGMPEADAFELCYDTPITGNVLRQLPEGAVDEALKKIEALEDKIYEKEGL